jgi:hypothetical protein
VIELRLTLEDRREEALHEALRAEHGRREATPMRMQLDGTRVREREQPIDHLRVRDRDRSGDRLGHRGRPRTERRRLGFDLADQCRDVDLLVRHAGGFYRPPWPNAKLETARPGCGAPKPVRARGRP